VEAMLMIDFSHYSNDVLEIIKLLEQIGWQVYNSENMIEFLPLGDKGNYNWKCENITREAIHGIILKKHSASEQIGINLYYNNEGRGLTVIMDNTEKVILDIGINRRRLDNMHTDIVWYIENIIYKFYKIGIKDLPYKVEEYLS